MRTLARQPQTPHHLRAAAPLAPAQPPQAPHHRLSGTCAASPPRLWHLHTGVAVSPASAEGGNTVKLSVVSPGGGGEGEVIIEL